MTHVQTAVRCALTAASVPQLEAAPSFGADCIRSRRGDRKPMAMTWRSLQKEGLLTGRVVISAVFFLVAGQKLLYGPDAPVLVLSLFGQSQIPSWVPTGSLLLMVGTEFAIAIAVWVPQLLRISLFAALGITAGGILLSVASLLLGFPADCGCGLLGENPTALLIQKGILLGVIGWVYTGRDMITRPSPPENTGMNSEEGVSAQGKTTREHNPMT